MRKHVLAAMMMGMVLCGFTASANEITFTDSLETITVDADTKIYAEPSVGSQGITYLMAGDSVQQIAVGDGWAKIVYNDQICYIQTAQGTAAAPAGTATTETPALQTEATPLQTEMAPLQPETAPAQTEAPTAVTESAAEPGAADAAQAAPAENVLSDNLYSFQISFDGTVYQFPMKYTDFIAKGWAYLEDTETLDANTYTTGYKNCMYGNTKASCFIINYDWNPAPLEDCYVGGIEFTMGSLDPANEVILPGGLVFDQSFTMEKAKALYGEPSYDSDGDSYQSYRYENDTYETVEFYFSKDDIAYSTVEVRNFSEPEDFTVSEVSNEIPEIVTKYQAPTALSDNLWDYTAEYAGALYTLPCPITEFEANGWTLPNGESFETITGNNWGHISMRLENKTDSLTFQNYSESATSAEYCFVYTLRGEKDFPMTIAGGITIGMSEQDMLAALGSTAYEKTVSDSNYTYYNIKNPADDSYNMEYGIVIGPDGLISSIEMRRGLSLKELEAIYASR